jgi:hypothetical protein
MKASAGGSVSTKAMKPLRSTEPSDKLVLN